MRNDSDNELMTKIHQHLKPGDTIKNYKQMCSLLGQQVCDGNSKIAQLKEWSRFFDYEKNGYKFIIREIYDVPNLKEGRCDSIYANHMNKCILNYLIQSENNTATLSKFDWYKVIGVINDRYKTISFFDLYKSSPILTINGINNFYTELNEKLWGVFRSSLRSLQDFHNMIKWSYEKTVVYQNGSSSIATESDKRKYEKAKSFAYGKLEISSMWLLNKRGLSRTFYQLVNEYILEHYGWSSYFEMINIRLVGDIDSLSVMKKDELQEEQVQLRNKIADTLEIRATEKYKNNEMQLDKIIREFEVEYGMPVTDQEDIHKIARMSDVWILPDNYLEEYKFLLNYFLRGVDEIDFMLND